MTFKDLGNVSYLTNVDYAALMEDKESRFL